MKTIKAVLVLAALAGAMASAPVLARGGHSWRGGHHHFRGHGHSHFGLFIGAPLLFAPWYVGPRYYYPPAVVVPSSPPVYVEQGQADAPGGAQYWYYCRESETYYPYVKECAGPWQKVVPQPPPS
ncbi:MAG TPA: hypothetical protein VFZ14_17875 [Burkholderiales bacterium]|nr:hypothetical protein [Burkholderiales bacterium]